MIIRSPYPDIAIPDVGLPEFLFAELDTDDADRLTGLIEDPQCSYGERVELLQISKAVKHLGVHSVALRR